MASIVESFEAEGSLQHLASFFGITLAPKTALEARGVVFGEGGEGESQGDPKASAGFCSLPWSNWTTTVELEEEPPLLEQTMYMPWALLK